MKKPAGKGGHRHIDHDEAADWDYAARSVEPLKRAKSRVRAGSAPDPDELPPRQKAEPAPISPRHKGKAEPGTTAAQPAPKKQTPPIADFDRKSMKRLRAGRIEIEGRIDLHGMRQDEAHAALRGFLFRAQGRGLRWVLVITGKGKVRSRSGDDDNDVIPVRDRGVLKRNVPRWMEEPDLRPLIVSYTTASIPHGGEGALYVHLRKKG